MIYQEINNSDFHTAFHRMDRGSQFSYEALDLLYDYFDSIGEDIELDVIAICCEYSEMHYSDIIGEYETDICEALGDDCTDEDAKIEYIREFLQDNTSLVGETTEGTFLFLQF